MNLQRFRFGKEKKTKRKRSEDTMTDELALNEFSEVKILQRNLLSNLKFSRKSWDSNEKTKKIILEKIIFF